MANNNFDIEFYGSFYPDLKHMSKEELLTHYNMFGKNEGRIICNISENTFYERYTDFCVNYYRDDHPELNYLSDKQLLTHYYYYNTHTQYNVRSPKEKFRLRCTINAEYLRNVHLIDFMESSDYESVFIEYRCLPHCEFLIRNAILKLGEKWCHTIICGKLNYEYMVQLCSTISHKIKVIQTNYDNLTPSEYSLFLSTLDFWNLLHGKKILIYQEDSLIFNHNIDDFLKWDYIGAPWSEWQNDNRSGVGNGGISLRTKDIMVQIINTISIHSTVYNSSTLDYIRNTNSTVPPEDVYFTKNMEDLNIGLLADRVSASYFSTECILNENSFAGHNFWISDPNWLNRVENTVVKFNYPSIVPEAMNEHRGGWNTIKQNLINNNLFSNNYKFVFYDMLDLEFLYHSGSVIDRKWSGIFHCTPITPDYLHFININNIFNNSNFIQSLKNCVCIITLSNYLSQFFINKFCSMNMNIPVYTIKHPVVTKNIPLFNLDEFHMNGDRRIIQIGQQLRKITSIYLLPDMKDYKKLWLTGTKDFDKLRRFMNHEIEQLHIDRNRVDMNNNIMTYLKNYSDYDILLTKNIIFIDLFDASANNVIVECIVRNTPIVVNKIPAVVDYLGEDYPLYFNNIDEIPHIITNENIYKAHHYLVAMRKDDLEIGHFTKELINILYHNFIRL